MMSLYIIIVLLFLLCNNIDIAKSARLPTCYENVNCSWTYFVHDTGTHPFATGECFKGFCKCRPAEVGQYCQFLKPRGGFSCKTQGNCKVKNGEAINQNAISGSHALTENDYLIFVYFRDIGEQYDSLIGIGHCNSFNLKN